MRAIPPMTTGFAVQKIVIRAISVFDESATVHIVLDRIDGWCDLKRKVDHREPLLKALVKMV